ncbi:unnamed protein product, partial [Prorocentrum cordatum]
MWGAVSNHRRYLAAKEVSLIFVIGFVMNSFGVLAVHRPISKAVGRVHRQFFRYYFSQDTSAWRRSDPKTTAEGRRGPAPAHCLEPGRLGKRPRAVQEGRQHTDTVYLLLLLLLLLLPLLLLLLLLLLVL